MQDDSHERKKQIAESWGDSRHGSFRERSTVTTWTGSRPSVTGPAETAEVTHVPGARHHSQSVQANEDSCKSKLCHSRQQQLNKHITPESKSHISGWIILFVLVLKLMGQASPWCINVIRRISCTIKTEAPQEYPKPSMFLYFAVQNSNQSTSHSTTKLRTKHCVPRHRHAANWLHVPSAPRAHFHGSR